MRIGGIGNDTRGHWERNNTDILLKMAIHKIVCEAIDNINVDNNSWELREIQIRKRIEIELDRWLPAKKIRLKNGIERGKL